LRDGAVAHKMRLWMSVMRALEWNQCTP